MNENLSKDDLLSEVRKRTKELMEETGPPQGFAGSTLEESTPNYFKH